MGPNFLPRHFSRNTRAGEEEVNGDATRARRGPTTWATTLATWWDPSRALSVDTSKTYL
jgi:hypothetical protein